MKTIISFFAVLVLFPIFAAADSDVSSQWDRANTAYINADYQTAITVYDSIAEAGNVGYKLYYNLGNAYFQAGNIGRAVLNYNLALKYKPTDRDAKYNLRIANAHVKDKVEPLPEFFLTGWTRSLRRSFSSDFWAVTGVAMLAVCLGCVLLYLLSGNLGLRKAGFYTAVVSLLLFVMTTSFAVREKNDFLNPSHAIIMSSAVPVKSSPDNGGRELFILHEGTKVEVTGQLGSWNEIMLEDGNKGWIQSNTIELIR